MAEVLFAVTSMLSFTRLAYILPAHESLGTLQISIGRMIDDMIRCVRSLSTALSLTDFEIPQLWYDMGVLDLSSSREV